MAENVTIQMNLMSGEISIQAPTDALNVVFDKLESFLPKLSEGHNKFASTPAKDVSQESPNLDQDSQTTQDQSGQADVLTKTTSKRKRNASSKKPESYSMVELGLDATKRTELRAFYSEKNPKNQNDQLLVIMAWFKDNAGKDVLTKDEIYTALRTVEAKIPARITSVLSNLGIEGRITSEADGFRIHHTGEDHVRLNLPKKDTQK